MRDLSSRMTLFYKAFLPSVWIGVFAFATIQTFLGRDSWESRWILLAITVGGTTVLYWLGMRLKRVRLDDDALLVSNYRREVRVPLREVERVTGSVFLNPEIVWLHFRRPTEFGTRIVFAPRVRPWRGFTPHPIVAELRELVEQARQTN
jgi:hypothetical protein